MKRANNLTPEIAKLENLCIAFWKARKGKDIRKDVMLIRTNLLPNLLNLSEQIISGQMNIGKYNYFKIYDPKERTICAASFEERVLHHAIMNICHQFFEKYQIYDSYACRKGKGTYAALERARYYNNKNTYFLKLDIRKYFDTVDHNYLSGILCKMFKDETLLKILKQIINSYCTKPGKGIPIGNLTSQYFANHILAKNDHYIKEDLRVKSYVRYMDDMVLWSNNKNQLIEWGKEIRTYIEDNLKQNLKSFCLNYVNKGVPFLGYVLIGSKVRLSKNSRKRFRKKIKQYNYNIRQNIWSQEEYQRHCLPLLAFTEYASATNFRINVFKQIKEDCYGY
jgi:RNA-directed DNA polymerase